MLTYPKWTMRVRRMPMHLSSGDVTLMPGKFSPPFFTPPLRNFLQSDLGRRADSRWALPQISKLFMFCYKFLKIFKIGELLILFSRRVISELRLPIAAKFCTILLSMFSFIIPGRHFGEAFSKNF